MNQLSNQLLVQFSQFIQSEMGIYFPENKHDDLKRAIHSISEYLKFSNVDDCMKQLMTNELTEQQIEVLAGYLTVGETYFFRDPGLYTTLKNTILPAYINTRSKTGKYLRIWSAGCSTGEEPYSVAITLLKTIPDISNWRISIIATDINIKSLKKIQAGIYTEWSFRGVPEEIKKMYFHQSENNSYTIKQIVKDMVEPSYINLCKDSYPSLINKTNAVDIIFCRNVLMYFSHELIRKIIERFYYCLSNDGYLIVSPCDNIYNYINNYTVETIAGTTVYRKKINTCEIPPCIPSQQVEEFISNDHLNIPDVIKVQRAIEVCHSTIDDVINLSGQGKLNEALLLINNMLPNDKTNIELYYLKAMILVELLRYDDAIISLNHVLYLNRNFVSAYIVLANLFLRQGNKSRAKINYHCAYNLLKKMDPNDKLPDSAGMTVEHVMHIVNSAMELT